MKDLKTFISEAKLSVQDKINAEMEQYSNEYLPKYKQIFKGQIKKEVDFNDQANGDRGGYVSYISGKAVVLKNGICVSTPIVESKRLTWIKDIYNKTNEPFIIIGKYNDNNIPCIEHDEKTYFMVITLESKKMFDCKWYFKGGHNGFRPTGVSHVDCYKFSESDMNSDDPYYNPFIESQEIIETTNNIINKI